MSHTHWWFIHISINISGIPNQHSPLKARLPPGMNKTSWSVINLLPEKQKSPPSALSWLAVCMNKTFQIMAKCLLAIAVMIAELALWLSDKITIPQIHGMPGNITHHILYKLDVRNVKKQTSLGQDRDFMPTRHSVLELFGILKVFGILLYLLVQSIFRDMLRWNYTHARCDDTGCYFSLVPPKKYGKPRLGESTLT